MTTFAIIQNGIVVNVAMADSEYAASQGWVALQGGAGIRWGWNGSAFTPPLPEPDPVPLEVTRRQGLQELRVRGITEQMVEDKINEYIADPLARDLALIELQTSQVFERYRALTLTMGAAFNLDLNAVFISAGKR